MVDPSRSTGSFRPVGTTGTPTATPFTVSIIIGYHQGQLAFIEPMVAKSYLEQTQSFQMAIPSPQRLPRDVTWPTQLTGTYDANAYNIVLSGFTTINQTGQTGTPGTTGGTGGTGGTTGGTGGTTGGTAGGYIGGPTDGTGGSAGGPTVGPAVGG